MQLFYRKWSLVCDNNGSSVVEAAIVFPAVVLITAMIVSAGLSMADHVKGDAEEHRNEAIKDLKSVLICSENGLRGVWMLEE